MASSALNLDDNQVVLMEGKKFGPLWISFDAYKEHVDWGESQIRKLGVIR
jgi:hypothetical protein